MRPQPPFASEMRAIATDIAKPLCARLERRQCLGGPQFGQRVYRRGADVRMALLFENVAQQSRSIRRTHTANKFDRENTDVCIVVAEKRQHERRRRTWQRLQRFDGCTTARRIR